MGLASRVALQQAEKILVDRAGELRARLPGEPALLVEYCEVVKALAAILPATAPGASGELLSTEEAAARFGISAKTLLRRKARGEVKPMIERGKFLRWSAGQTL